MVYLVTYDLNSPGQDYQRLYTAIEQLSHGMGYIHCLESTWLINTHLNADQIVGKLSSYIDKNDGLFVAKITPDCQAQLPKEQCKWIEDALSKGLL